MNKREELIQTKVTRPLSEIRNVARDAPPVRSLVQALGSEPKKGEPRVKVIAEIKKASPSRGIIKEDMDPREIALQYCENGAAAISVLTERDYFQGELENVHLAKSAGSLPVLRKDFIFDEYQIYETRACKADSFLLIASILETAQLVDLFFMGTEMGMHPLIEVHDEDDLEKALTAPCRLVGINNRDLKTFKTDINTSLRLIDFIPDDRLVVSESGIKSCEDIKTLRAAGVRAFLIGELFMAHQRPGDKLRELLEPCGPAEIE
jgi:indole-3-glycerol phosphate synthase